MSEEAHVWGSTCWCAGHTFVLGMLINIGKTSVRGDDYVWWETHACWKAHVSLRVKKKIRV